MSRVRLALGLALLAALAGSLAAARPAQAISPSIVISQVYGGGGNTGATLKNDFMELFNRGTTAVNVTGWSIQYASSAGTTWFKTTLSGTIPPGGYYLVKQAAGAGGTVELPPPDAIGTTAMSATAGKIALRSDDVTIPGVSCPKGDSVDFVGYGAAANCSEGDVPTATLSNTTAALRGEDGCRETDNNSVDFAAGAPNPRNSSVLAPVCPDPAPFVAATDPSNGASDVPLDSNVTITFSEPVTATGDWFAISCKESGAHSATDSGGPTTFVLDPASDFTIGETCTVTVFASGVADVDGDDPPDNMSADHVFSFDTVPLPARIREIQGASHLSPLDQRIVSDVPGVVTARAPNGFYMQDAEPDASDATSEGIFVFTSSAPAASITVGTAVMVGGRVSEFRAGCTPSCDPASGAFDNLTITEIVNPQIEPAGPGAPIAPTIIGAGGRIPPSTVIEDDASGNVETSGVFDPAQDGIDYYESLEGMLVGLNDAVAVGPTNAFGEIPVVGDGGADAGVRTTRGGVVISANDFNPERVILDDVIVPAEPKVDVNDRFASVRGVMDYNFGNFKLQVTQPLVEIDGGLQREATVPQRANQLAVGSFNVENLSPLDPPSKFAELAGLIVNNLRSPDIIGVQEIQDNDGPANSADTDASTTYTMLIGAIQAAGGPAYDFRQVDPVDDQDGGQPGGNIRVGFLFNPARVRFEDRPGGTSTTANTVDGRGGGAHLRYNPGRVDPNNTAFENSRKPLAAEFKFHGERLFLIVNHFNSKGGDDPLFGRHQPPIRVTETQRHAQATVVNDFVEQILAANRRAFVVVLGDLNDFEFSETLGILKDDDLLNLMDTLPKAERYSYVFEGNSQVLDQMLVTPRLLTKARPEYDVVHVNSEFSDQASDHEPEVARFTFD